MKKMAWMVMISLMLGGFAFGFEMNQESLRSGHFITAHEISAADFPRCYVFYHDQENNDWDFYCLPATRCYVFYHNEADNEWDIYCTQ